MVTIFRLKISTLSLELEYFYHVLHVLHESSKTCLASFNIKEGLLKTVPGLGYGAVQNGMLEPGICWVHYGLTF